MIFYGTKGSHLKSDRINSAKCNQCNEQTSHNVSIFGRYFYIYWIPIFPISKKGVAECNNCKATVEPKNMSEQLRLKYNNINNDTKTPFTYWIGLIILIGLFALIIFSSSKHKEEVVDFIANPEKGDIVDYKTSDYYSTLKIVAVSNDSVYFVRNNYEIERKSKLYKIDKEKNYDSIIYGLSRSKYQKLFTDKEFLDVDR